MKKNAPADTTELSAQVIFFDDVCVLCDKSVHFILRNDPKAHFRFASLQSDYAKSMLQGTILPEDQLKSLVLLREGSVYTEARAVLLVASKLKFPWCCFAVFRGIPDGLLNPLYRFVSRNRYKWFGKFDSCPLPSDEFKARWIDSN